tara:strand:+ start:597 stop:998 length:402 start_codon:yes stop_codon:yes gene_type:complete
MEPALIVQALGITIAAIIGIAQYSSRAATKAMKEELKLDIEIREKFEPDCDEYKIINQRIDELFKLSYQNSGSRFQIHNWDDLLIGGSLIAISSYLTLWLIEQNNYWAALSAFMVVVGFGMVPDAFKPEVADE